MLPPVGQGCWDEIYSSTSQSQRLRQVWLSSEINACIYMVGWLPISALKALFSFWLCTGGQEAGMAPTYTFSYLLQLFWHLSSNDFQGRANMNMYGTQWSTCIFDGSHRTTVTSKRRGSRSSSKQSELRKQLETAAEHDCVWYMLLANREKLQPRYRNTRPIDLASSRRIFSADLVRAIPTRKRNSNWSGMVSYLWCGRVVLFGYSEQAVH